MKPYVTILLLCLALTGKSQYNYDYQPHPFDEDEEVEYHQGHAFLVSYKDNSMVAITARRVDKNHLLLHTVIYNYSEYKTNFFPDSIRVLSIKDGREIQYKTESSDEYIKSIKEKNEWGNLLAGIGLAMSSYGAGYQNASVTTTDQYGNVYRSDISYYDQEAADKVYDRNDETMRRRRESQENRVDQIENALLKNSTIYSEDYIIGGVMVEIPKKDRSSLAFKVEVDILGDQHIMVFSKDM